LINRSSKQAETLPGVVATPEMKTKVCVCFKSAKKITGFQKPFSGKDVFDAVD
jgi:hypothetical protein